MGHFPQGFLPLVVNMTEGSGIRFPSSTRDLDWEGRVFLADQASQPLSGCPSRLQILLFSEAFRKFSSNWTTESGVSSAPSGLLFAKPTSH